ncbi:MAG: gamma-glutamylcyclotransferase [Alphaproteobacteria bacterium]|nr:gamma-glutamylcyclotransferase [Alphaproteobacteria bacterium]
MRFFLYGTLMDADVRRLVMGRGAPETVEPASVKGWRRVNLSGVTYPGIVRDAKGKVEGVLARGLGAAAKRRLVRYEGREYDLIEVEIATDSGAMRRALMFVTNKALKPVTGRWELALWQRRHKKRFLGSLARNGNPS